MERDRARVNAGGRRYGHIAARSRNSKKLEAQAAWTGLYTIRSTDVAAGASPLLRLGVKVAVNGGVDSDAVIPRPNGRILNSFDVVRLKEKLGTPRHGIDCRQVPRFFRCADATCIAADQHILTRSMSTHVLAVRPATTGEA
jgi:hypothetical protein